MAINLTKHVLQVDIYNFIKYPYYTGQHFFTIDTHISYEDVSGYRCAIVPSKLIVSSVDLITDTALKNNFVILNNNGAYSIYYYDDTGYPNFITGSGSSFVNHNDLPGIQGGTAGSHYHSNQSIDTTDTPTFAGVKILSEWEISNEDGNLAILENDGATTTQIITIYKTQSPTLPNSKVEIKAKTTIDELDFGGW